MSFLLIEEACPIHVGMIAKRIREDDRREIEELWGSKSKPADVRKAIRYCFHTSCIRRVAFLEGEIVALWGCTGTILSIESFVWLVTTKAIEKMPLRFLREARRELSEMLQSRRVLRAHAAADYTKAIRFFRLVGFEIGEPQPLGRQGGMFCEIRMEA